MATKLVFARKNDVGFTTGRSGAPRRPRAPMARPPRVSRGVFAFCRARLRIATGHADGPRQFARSHAPARTLFPRPAPAVMCALSCLLNRGTRQVAVRAKNAAIAGLGPEHRLAPLAFVEENASVRRHRFGGFMAAEWTGYRRHEMHRVALCGHSTCGRIGWTGSKGESLFCRASLPLSPAARKKRRTSNPISP